MISEKMKNDRLRHRIDQLERDHKHLENHVEKIRNGVNDNKQIPPKIPGDVYN